MLLYFKDAINGNSVAINPKYVTAVFVVDEGEHKGKTVINMTSGTLLTNDSQLDVVGRINGEFK